MMNNSNRNPSAFNQKCSQDKLKKTIWVARINSFKPSSTKNKGNKRGLFKGIILELLITYKIGA